MSLLGYITWPSVTNEREVSPSVASLVPLDPLQSYPAASASERSLTSTAVSRCKKMRATNRKARVTTIDIESVQHDCDAGSI